MKKSPLKAAIDNLRDHLKQASPAEDAERFIQHNSGTGSTDACIAACKYSAATLIVAPEQKYLDIPNSRPISAEAAYGKHIIDDSAVMHIVRHARATEEMARELIRWIELKNLDA